MNPQIEADAMAYEPQFDFSDFQSTNPTRPLPGHQLDVELWNIRDDVTGLRTDLKKIQRSDGALNNGIVKFETLAADVAPRLAVLQGGNAVSFASRADFVLALSAPWADSALVAVSGIFFRRSVGATAIADLPGWVPDGDVTPNHFKDNSTPGTTDMTAAFQAAADYSERVYGLAEDYRISDTVYFREFGTTGFQACGFHGKGPLVTRIIQSNQTKDAFAVIRSNQTASFLTVPSFRDFSIHFALTVGNTSDCAGIRTREAINGEYVNVHIFGSQWGFANERVGQCRFEGCFYQGGWNMRTKGAFLWTHNPHTNTNNCYGNYVTNCEVSGSTFGATSAHDLEAVDGLYITNCHWNNCLYYYRIGANGDGGKVKATSLHINNTYHDDSNSVPKLSDFVFSKMTGAANSFYVWGLSVNGGIVRTERANAKMISFSFAAADDLVGLYEVAMVTISGVNIRGYRGRAVDMTLPAGMDSKAILKAWTLNGNLFYAPLFNGNGITDSQVFIAGTGISLEGNVFSGAWTDATSPPVYVTPRSDRVTIGDGNVFDCARSIPVVTEATATNTNYLRHASYANDAAAATAGVPLRGIYRGTDGNIKWRMA